MVASDDMLLTDPPVAGLVVPTTSACVLVISCSTISQGLMQRNWAGKEMFHH
jgi:hypothetical protein